MSVPPGRRLALLAALAVAVAGVFLRRAAYYAARPGRFAAWLRRTHGR